MVVSVSRKFRQRKSLRRISNQGLLRSWLLALDSQEFHPRKMFLYERIGDFCENHCHFLLLAKISGFEKYFVNSNGYDTNQRLALKMLFDNYHQLWIQWRFGWEASWLIKTSPFITCSEGESVRGGVLSWQAWLKKHFFSSAGRKCLFNRNGGVAGQQTLK